MKKYSAVHSGSAPSSFHRLFRFLRLPFENSKHGRDLHLLVWMCFRLGLISQMHLTLGVGCQLQAISLAPAHLAAVQALRLAIAFAIAATKSS